MEMRGVGNAINHSAIISENCTLNNVVVGERTRICEYVNMYGCEVGDDSLVASFCELQSDTKIGNRSRISTHTFICSGVTIGDDCFIGHSCVFINDTFSDGTVHFDKKDWKKTVIGNNVKIGSNATIFPVFIGENSTIGAGAIITKDVPPNSVIIGTNKKLR